MKIPEKLETKRLTIRKFAHSDKGRFLEFMRDTISTKYLMLTDEQKTETGASGLFEYVLNSYESDTPIFSMAIETEKYGYVGSCGLSPIDGDIWECYYSLNREFLKKGFATESLKALIDYCFNELNTEELRAYMSPENLDSSRVAERCGMEHKGIQVHPIFKNKGKLYCINRK
ncbi:MAG: GNAT family N-acetyltransferase [Ignavibacterium sp.]|nr:GNAT family N-acetyltransferase [Ignavibacterium sp.]